MCGTLSGQTTPAAAGKAAAEKEAPVIRTTSREVLLDLVVRDKHNHPIANLRPEEIEVYEDGVRQQIKAFRDVEGKEQLQAEQRAAASEASTQAPAQPRKTLRQVNFVSIVFAQIAPLNLEFAHQAVLEFLKSDNLPNTFVTIYSLSRNLELKQAYTNDKDALLRAADTAAKGLSTNAGLDVTTSLANSAIQSALANLALQPPGPGSQSTPTMNVNVGALATNPLFARNSSGEDASFVLGSALEAQGALYEQLRFVSSYVDGMAAMDSLHELVRSQEKLPGRKIVLYLSDGLSFPEDRRDVVDHLISFANRSGVTFYTVNTQGLSVRSPMTGSLAAQDRTNTESQLSRAMGSSSTAGTGATRVPPSGHDISDEIQLTAVSNTQLNQRELAEATGGFAVENTNEIATPMQRMMEDIRNHYELAYAPTSTVYDGHFRKIEVEIARPKVTVETRNGYYALPELRGEPLQPYEAVALRAINTQPAPVGFPYQVALIKLRPKAETVTFQMAFEVPLASLKIIADPKTGKTYARVSLVALFHDASGEVIGKVSRELVREVSNQNTPGTDRILYAEPLDLPAGHFGVEAAVTDEQAASTAVRRLSAFVDPGKDLGLSSLEIVGRVEPARGPRNLLDPFDLGTGRILPTLADSLPSTQPVGLFFIVYPAKGEDPKVTLQLIRDGKEVARKPLGLPKPESDGSFPVLVELSPGLGQWDIIVTAQQGNLVAQSVRSLKME
jgi:VWFA-related protein